MIRMNQVKFLTQAFNADTVSESGVNNSSDRDLSSLETLILHLKKAPLLPALSAQALAFIQQLSKQLLSNPSCKEFPELIALGFWLRKSNLHKLLQQQGFGEEPLAGKEPSAGEEPSAGKEPSAGRKPLGLVIHFTPANVDTMFIYSWVAALLLGNSSIVRVASKESESQTILLTIINHLFLMNEHQEISQRNCFISFSKHSDNTALLCAHADARLIWGGDQSVAAILAHSAPKACVDLCFADKFSAAILAGIDDSNLKNIAKLLWRDTQPYLQQACSSPRILYWLKSHKNDKQHLHALLSVLNEHAQRDRQSGWHSLSQANEHLVTAQQIMASSTDREQPELLTLAAVSGLEVKRISKEMLELHSGNGFFICKFCENIGTVFEDIAKLNSKKLQTLSYCNLTPETLLQQKQARSIAGIDRIVPLGQALDFSFHWDGYDLLHELSKKDNDDTLLIENI